MQLIFTITVLNAIDIYNHLSFNSFVVMDSTTAKGMPPEYVAQRIVGAIARQQQDLILAPIHHLLSVYLRVLTPSLFNFIMRIRARRGMAGES